MKYEPIAQEVFAYFLVFARLGAVLMTLPGVGEQYVPVRVRLLFAFALTLVMAPVLASRLPGLPGTVSVLIVLLGSEVFFGLLVGLLIRLVVTALSWGGTIISFLSGFSAAQIFNPLLADQGSLSSVLLSLGGLLMIYATGTHHLLFYAIADSYAVFTPGTVPDFGASADTYARVLSQTFVLSMQFATPFIIFGIVFYTGMGLLARLQPQMPVFFVAMPLQIALGLIVLLMTISTILLWFIDRFQATLTSFFVAS